MEQFPGNPEHKKTPPKTRCIVLHTWNGICMLPIVMKLLNVTEQAD
jgi:hypothetical protein